MPYKQPVFIYILVYLKLTGTVPIKSYCCKCQEVNCLSQMAIFICSLSGKDVRSQGSKYTMNREILLLFLLSWETPCVFVVVIVLSDKNAKHCNKSIKKIHILSCRLLLFFWNKLFLMGFGNRTFIFESRFSYECDRFYCHTGVVQVLVAMDRKLENSEPSSPPWDMAEPDTPGPLNTAVVLGENEALYGDMVSPGRNPNNSSFIIYETPRYSIAMLTLLLLCTVDVSSLLNVLS